MSGSRQPDITDDARPLPLSALLTQILEGHPGDRLTLTEFSSRLRDRMWGGLLLTFAAINVLPLPPGTSLVTGIPLLIVTAQMAAGRSSPWFPRRADRRGLTKRQIGVILAKLLPLERRVERIFRPRLYWLTNHRGARAIGAVSFLLSVVLWLPIPLGNHAPALSMTLFALSLLYRDGVLVVLGGIATLVSIALISVTLGAAWLAVMFALHHLFSGF